MISSSSLLDSHRACCCELALFAIETACLLYDLIELIWDCRIAILQVSEAMRASMQVGLEIRCETEGRDEDRRIVPKFTQLIFESQSPIAIDCCLDTE